MLHHSFPWEEIGYLSQIDEGLINRRKTEILEEVSDKGQAPHQKERGDQIDQEKNSFDVIDDLKQQYWGDVAHSHTLSAIGSMYLKIMIKNGRNRNNVGV